jgi:hypothetical protein
MGTHGPPQAAQRPPQLIEHGRRDLGAGFTAAFEHGSTMTYGEAVEHGRSLLSDLRQAAE